MPSSRSGWGFFLKLAVLALFAVAVLLAPFTLRADTVTYTLNPGDTLSDGGSISGTFTEDLSTKHVTGTIIADGMTFTCNNCPLIIPQPSQIINGIATDIGFVALGQGGNFVVLGWSSIPPLASIITLNSASSYCKGCVTAGVPDFLSANDTAANVPEPSTALLLMSGLAWVPFIRRRRVTS
jgi:hypothetical protein